MDKKLYERNRIYISDEKQNQIKNFRVFIGGAGLGSNIAEVALRLGFEYITIADGDLVSESNLNRQNYAQKDIGRKKVDVLKERLLAINPNAQISTISSFIDRDNVRDLLAEHNVAINAIDFTSDIPFLFDDVCRELGITVLHPFNVGFAGVVMVAKPDSLSFRRIIDENEDSELPPEVKAIRYVVDYFNYWGKPKLWLDDVLYQYQKENFTTQPPQLSIASCYVAGMVTSVLYRLATGGFVKVLPKFYYYSEYDDLN